MACPLRPTTCPTGMDGHKSTRAEEGRHVGLIARIIATGSAVLLSVLHKELMRSMYWVCHRRTEAGGYERAGITRERRDDGWLHPLHEGM